MELFRKRIIALGGNYLSSYSILFDVLKQEQRHIDHWNRYIQTKQSTLNMVNTSNNNLNDQISSTLIVPKNCISIIHHSKYNLSLFTIYDRFITESNYLLLNSFIKPFKLKQRINKTIHIKNGDCYNWKDFIISFSTTKSYFT